MHRPLLVLFCLTLSANAAERNVSIRFLGGANKTPLEGLRVTIRAYTGDHSVDRKRTLTDGKTGKDGAVGFVLADGWYYVDVGSDRDLPYLDRPVGFKDRANLYSRMIKVGKAQSFEFNLADACRLTLRAVEVDTGKGLPGAVFATEIYRVPA